MLFAAPGRTLSMSGAFNPALAEDRARDAHVTIGVAPTACRSRLKS